MLLPVLVALVVGTSRGEPADRRLSAVRSTTAVPVAVPVRSLAGAWCAEPTGADRPGSTLGPTVHVVYAIPADAPDGFAELGPAIAADAEAVDGWWRRQDPGRALRFDRYPASCGDQLDLTLVRLSETTRYFQRFAVQGDMIFEDIVASGAAADSGVTLAYYSGPVADSDVCGEGSGDPDEMVGRVVVFVANCTDRDRARIVAHELLHAFGALPEGARHPCPDDGGHPCDDESDVLWPRVDLRPLEALSLDVGRDDYYGHGGNWPDVRDSPFLVRLDEQRTRVTVAIRGRGSVLSSLFGLSCEATCTTQWDTRLDLALEARPAEGMRFVRWEGDCASRTCVVALAGKPITVRALFAEPTFTLTLQRSGRGRIVTGAWQCAASCSRSVQSYKKVVVRALPQKGWRFARWDGPCRGSDGRCALELTQDTALRAVFERAAVS